MATTKRPVNLKFKNATKVINNTEQQFQEDVTFDKDVDVTGDLGTDGNISCDGAVTVGTTVELLSQGAAVAPVAAGGTLTDVAGELFWKTAAQERQITHATAYFFRDSTKVVGGGAGAACTVAVGNGHIVSFQGTLTAFDTVAGTYAFADIQGAATAADGVAALLDTSCTVHVDNIGLAGAPAVGVAGGNVTIVLQADPANATHFHADIRVCDVVALIP